MLKNYDVYPLIKDRAHKYLNFLSRTDIFCYLLIWLIILLITGTIAQKNIGLYLAQKKYFSSFILWEFNIIPLPGGYTIMFLIFISLLARLLLYDWKIQNTGSIIVHLGALFLLLGGGITAKYSHEGSMIIKENSSTNFISDYHQRELVITRSDNNETISFNITSLKQNYIESTLLPFTFTIEKIYKNTKITKQEDSLILEEQTPFKDDEQNIYSVIFTIKIKDPNNNHITQKPPTEVHKLIEDRETNTSKITGKKRYSIFEFMAVPEIITVNGDTYQIEIRKKRTFLPFTIHLTDFEKQSYPGTNQAKSYTSKIIIKERDLKWKSIITMNKPLRYKGYTFYQTSFIKDQWSEFSVLTAVKNTGRLFPYISSILICIGLLIHLIIRNKIKYNSQNSKTVNQN